MTRTLAMLLLLAVALPTPVLWAREYSGLDVGSRVRVAQAPRGSKVEGTLLARDPEALTLKIRGVEEFVQVPLDSVLGVEVRRGSKGNAGTGALIGLVAGAALGYAAGEDCSGNEWMCFNRGATTPAVGIVGAGLGALVGLAIRSERWEEVDPDRLRVAIAPTRGGGVGAQVSFGF